MMFTTSVLLGVRVKEGDEKEEIVVEEEEGTVKHSSVLVEALKQSYSDMPQAAEGSGNGGNYIGTFIWEKWAKLKGTHKILTILGGLLGAYFSYRIREDVTATIRKSAAIENSTYESIPKYIPREEDVVRRLQRMIALSLITICQQLLCMALLAPGNQWQCKLPLTSQTKRGDLH